MGGCVHTIAVKRSKRVCSSKAGINEGLKEQSNFTKFHRGRGGPGGESVWLILLCQSDVATKQNKRTRRTEILQTDTE